MKVPRVAVLMAAIFSILLWLGCGDTYRPVATPITGPGGDPEAFRVAMVLAHAPDNSGATSLINVSGDTLYGNVVAGTMPVHSVFLGTSKVFTVNRESDTVTVQFPASDPFASSTIALRSSATDRLQPVYAQLATFTSATGVQTTNLYVANFGDNSVSVIDNSTDSVTKKLPVGTQPVAMTALPDGSRVYVANRGPDASAGSISVISTGANTTGTITLPPEWGKPKPVFAVANSTGTAVFVLLVNAGSQSIAAVDPATDTPKSKVDLGLANPACAATPIDAPCASMAFDPKLQRLYVANYGDGTVSVFDAANTALNLIATIRVGTHPVAVAPIADGSRVYVLNKENLADSTCGAGGTLTGQVSVINTSSNSVVTCIAVKLNPVWLAASGDGGKVYVPYKGIKTTDEKTTITPGTQVIRTSTNLVIADVPTPRINPNDTSSARMTPTFVVPSP